jgi:hypothetical protein
MRDQVMALASLRHGLPAREARGVDDLPTDIRLRLEEALARRLEAGEIGRAFRAATAAFLDEVRRADAALGSRLDAAVREIGGASA